VRAQRAATALAKAPEPPTLKRNPEPEQQGRQTPCWRRISETPVLMAFLLALWRWLMPPATAMDAPAHRVQAPQIAVPAAVRNAFRLAPILAPPLRLLT
jgi:hypothetical protein